MRNSKRLFLLGVVLAGMNSCEEVLERSLVDKKVELQAPVNNLVTTDSLHNFAWAEMEGATEYQLQVVSPRFDSITKVLIDTRLPELLYDEELPKGIYQWRVRAINNSTVSNYSDAWNLTIQ